MVYGDLDFCAGDVEGGGGAGVKGELGDVEEGLIAGDVGVDDVEFAEVTLVEEEGIGGIF